MMWLWGGRGGGVVGVRMSRDFPCFKIFFFSARYEKIFSDTDTLALLQQHRRRKLSAGIKMWRKKCAGQKWLCNIVCARLIYSRRERCGVEWLRGGMSQGDVAEGWNENCRGFYIYIFFFSFIYSAGGFSTLSGTGSLSAAEGHFFLRLFS